MKKLIAELRREKFDKALLLQNAFEAAWLAWRAGIPERIGYVRATSAVGSLNASHTGAGERAKSPRTKKYYYLELLRRAGWLDRLPASVETSISLRVADNDRDSATQRVVSAGARPGAMWVAFAPGAAYGSAKCWEPERYAALADELIAAYDADVILFGTPAESEMAARIERAMHRRAISLVGATTIGEPSRAFSRHAACLSATIPGRCTWRAQLACRSSASLAPPIRTVRRR